MLLGRKYQGWRPYKDPHVLFKTNKTLVTPFFFHKFVTFFPKKPPKTTFNVAPKTHFSLCIISCDASHSVVFLRASSQLYLGTYPSSLLAFW